MVTIATDGFDRYPSGLSDLERREGPFPVSSLVRRFEEVFRGVRKICFDRNKFSTNQYIPELWQTLGEELLTPTRLYPKVCLPLFGQFDIRGMVHITGGGFYDNIPRVLPEGCSVAIDTTSWPMPPIFPLLKTWGNVGWPEMFRTFNMGIGMILVVPASQVDAVLLNLTERGERAYVIGTITPGIAVLFLRGAFSVNRTVLGVLVSGRGSNLHAIFDAIQADRLKAKIGVVISDNPDALALKRIAGSGITTVVVEREKFPSGYDFEMAIAQELRLHHVELVVLAGFMRLLSPEFIRLFPARIMNIHPALLPAFAGLDAQAQAIAYGVKVSGCTVHFVDEGVDTGPIILQEAVPVYDHDSQESLAERILHVEHVLYPRAIGFYCEGRLHIDGRKVTISEK